MLSELVKKLPAFYGTRNFVIMVKTARHFCLFWARTIQSRFPSYFLKINFNIIFPSPPRFRKLLLSFMFPHQKHINTSHLCRTFHIPHLFRQSWSYRTHVALSAGQMTKLPAKQFTWNPLFIVTKFDCKYK